MRIVPVCNRGASEVDLKTADDARYVGTKVSPAANTRAKFIRRFLMPRRLVPLSQYVKEAEDRGEDLNSLYIDPEDVAELDEEDPENED